MPPRLRAAIIGCGRIAGGYDEHAAEGEVRTHAGAYRRHPATELIAVADARPDVAAAFAARWSVKASYTEPKELLEDARPDLVSICTPDESHAEMLELCLAYSVRAVWCEKPLAVDQVAAGEIVAEYERRGITLAVNYMRRWDPEIQRLGRVLRSGEIGRVQRIVVLYGKGIRHNGSHAIDLLLDWFGPVAESRVLGGFVDSREDDPTVDARLVFRDGPVAYLVGCDDRAYGIWEMDILGETARARLVAEGAAVEWYAAADERIAPGARALAHPPRRIETRLPTVMTTVLDNVVAAARAGEPLRSDGRSALATLRVCNELIAKTRETAWRS